jgi:CheY-like chemotaxis protein
MSETHAQLRQLARRVLVVDDDPGDVLLIEEALTSGGRRRAVDVAGDGQEALDFLRLAAPSSDSRPDLILLDLNMPCLDGREFLQVAKESVDLRTIPVVVFTISSSPVDILESYTHHANAFVTKPVDLDGFSDAVRRIDEFYTQIAAAPPGRPLPIDHLAGSTAGTGADRARPPEQRAMRVLVVEADLAVRNELAGSLRSGGHLVLAVEGTGSALATIASLGCPDVVVVDVDRHAAGVSELLTQMRQHLCPQPPGVVVLSHDPSPDRALLHLNDADLHLSPHHGAAELLRAVAEVHRAAQGGHGRDETRRCLQLAERKNTT